MSQPLPDDVVVRLAPYVPERGLREMRVVTGAPWSRLPALLSMGAVTLGRYAIFREGRYDPMSASRLALIAHESMHVTQWRELGVPRFLVRYALGALSTRFRHGDHPMERDLIQKQDEIRDIFSSVHDQ